MKNQEFQEMSLIEHITELRKRLLWSFLYIIIIFVFCFYFADILFAFLARPLVNLMDLEKGQGFIYTALQEAFFTELKIAFFFSLFFAFPLIAIQIWKFIAPGLYKNEKNAFLTFFNSNSYFVFCRRSYGLLFNFTNCMEIFYVLSEPKFIRSSNSFRS